MAKKMAKKMPEVTDFYKLGIEQKAAFYRQAMARIRAADLRAALAAYLAAFDFVDTLMPHENVGQIIGTMSAAADPNAIRVVIGHVIKKRNAAQSEGIRSTR